MQLERECVEAVYSTGSNDLSIVWSPQASSVVRFADEQTREEPTNRRNDLIKIIHNDGPGNKPPCGESVSAPKTKTMTRDMRKNIVGYRRDNSRNPDYITRRTKNSSDNQCPPGGRMPCKRPNPPFSSPEQERDSPRSMNTLRPKIVTRNEVSAVSAERVLIQETNRHATQRSFNKVKNASETIFTVNMRDCDGVILNSDEEDSLSHLVKVKDACQRFKGLRDQQVLMGKKSRKELDGEIVRVIGQIKSLTKQNFHYKNGITDLNLLLEWDNYKTLREKAAPQYQLGSDRLIDLLEVVQKEQTSENLGTFKRLLMSDPLFFYPSDDDLLEYLVEQVLTCSTDVKVSLSQLIGMNRANYDVPYKKASSIRLRPLTPEELEGGEAPEDEGYEISVETQLNAEALLYGPAPKGILKPKEQPGSKCSDKLRAAKKALGIKSKDYKKFAINRKKIFKKCNACSVVRTMRKGDINKLYKVKFDSNKESVDPTVFDRFGGLNPLESNADFLAWTTCLPNSDVPFKYGMAPCRMYKMQYLPNVDIGAYNHNEIYRKTVLNAKGKFFKSTTKPMREELAELRKLWNELTYKNRSKRDLNTKKPQQPKVKNLNMELYDIWVQRNPEDSDDCRHHAQLIQQRFETVRQMYPACEMELHWDDYNVPYIVSDLFKGPNYSDIFSTYKGLKKGPLKRVLGELKAVTNQFRMKKGRAKDILNWEFDPETIRWDGPQLIMINGIQWDIDTVMRTHHNRGEPNHWIENALWEGHLYDNINQMVLDYHNNTMCTDMAKLMVTEVSKQAYLTQGKSTNILPPELLKCGLTPEDLIPPAHIIAAGDAISDMKGKKPKTPGVGAPPKRRNRRRRKTHQGRIENDMVYDPTDDYVGGQSFNRLMRQN
jgi:hypothetical protein